MADWLQQFVDDGTIGESQLEEARSMASTHGITVEDALSKLGYIDANVVGRANAAALNLEYIDLENVQIPNSVIELVPESMARENLIIPTGIEGESVQIAMHNPSNIEVLDKLRFVLNRDIRVVVSALESIQGAINRHYGQTETESVDSMISEFTETQIDFTELEAKASEPSPTTTTRPSFASPT